MKLPRWARRTLPLVVLVAASAWWLAAATGGEDEADWVGIERDDLVLTVEVTGTLAAIDSSFIGPPQIRNLWEYKIASLADEGTEVEEGTPVLGFDTTELDRALKEKQAARDAAQKTIDKYVKEYDLQRRAEELRLAEAEGKKRKASLKVDRPGELSSAKELWQARLDLEEAEKEIAFVTERLASLDRSHRASLQALRDERDAAERRVREIEESIEKMNVKAPRNGTVVYVSNWRDEKKKVGDSVWRGEKVLEIPDLTKMEAKGEVDEAESGRVAVGQKVSFRLDAHPDTEFTGAVSSIWSTVQQKSWREPLKVVRLDIALGETDTMRMRPGMRFRGTIETGRVADVLVIPAEAVFPGKEGPRAYRKTLWGYETVIVKLGKRNEKWVEVLEGLEPGDDVARRDLEALKRRRA